MRPEIIAQYMGLNLSSPLIVGACPRTRCAENVRQYAIAGAGAVVLPSLFEEQIIHQRVSAGLESSEQESRIEGLTYQPSEDEYNGGPENYLRAIEDLKRVTSIPIIASLDGFTGGDWLTFAREIESGGADALELNLHTDFADPSLDADTIEQSMLDRVQTVCDLVSIPVSVKLLPFHTSLANLAWRLSESGAAGLVVFGRDANWIVSPDQLRATTQWSLSPAGAISSTISGLVRVRCGGPHISIAACGGASSPGDCAQLILAGADVVMVASEVHREGPDAISHMVEGLISFLERHGFDSFQALIRGRPEPQLAISQRLNYLQPLTRPANYHDPTPGAVAASGDRWGHRDDDSRRRTRD
jgi:dihydroorotate dehydrogenase (fumarate)